MVDHVLEPIGTVARRPDGGPAAALRGATLDVHRETEQAPFIVELLSGRLGAPDLARLLGQLRPVYAALESSAAPYRDDPLLGRLFDRRLDRLTAIDHDLAELAGAAMADVTMPLPETIDYVDRIMAVRTRPPRLVAHHYVRYLGDLSGGQIIAALMRRHYHLPNKALTFFGFEGLGSKSGFKAAYRRALDELLASREVYAAVVDETRLAYGANRSVFDALGQQAG